MFCLGLKREKKEEGRKRAGVIGQELFCRWMRGRRFRLRGPGCGCECALAWLLLLIDLHLGFDSIEELIERYIYIYFYIMFEIAKAPRDAALTKPILSNCIITKSAWQIESSF